MPQHSAPGHDIVVVGASTGGVEALAQLASGLPDDLPAAVFAVLHLPPQAPSHLPQILARYGPLPASQPRDGEPIHHGRIYVAPPDFHLMVERGRVRVVRGPRENRHRPAIDPLFRTAALAYGPRVLGVILTGALDDGTAGLYAVKQRGGMAVVQDPHDALIDSMPRNALEYVAVDHCLPLREIPALIARLAREPAPPETRAASAAIVIESAIDEAKETVMGNENPVGTLSAFTCPECRGPLWEIRDGELLRFRCRAGHAFSSESMIAGQSEALDEALWAAFNTLNESAILSERLAADARVRGHTYMARRMAERAREQRKRASVVRAVIGEGNGVAPAPDEDAGEAESGGEHEGVVGSGEAVGS
jgi:two-component system, chemotaxis family, protein-glutamate methylesterase/glutaminase